MRRWTLAAFWLGAGTLHFGRPRSYEAIVPGPLRRYRRELVVVSGAAELAGGARAAMPATRSLARWWLLALLAAVFPANVAMALHAERFPAIPRWALWARLPLQGAFAWHAWRGTD